MTKRTDKDLESELETASSVLQAFEQLSKATPPQALDDQILAAAYAAVEKRDDTVVTMRRWRQWSIPVALAASVIVAVPLVVRVYESPDTPSVKHSASAAEPRTAEPMRERLDSPPVAPTLTPLQSFANDSQTSSRKKSDADESEVVFDIVSPPSAPATTVGATRQSVSRQQEPLAPVAKEDAYRGFDDRYRDSAPQKDEIPARDRDTTGFATAPPADFAGRRNNTGSNSAEEQHKTLSDSASATALPEISGLAPIERADVNANEDVSRDVRMETAAGAETQIVTAADEAITPRSVATQPRNAKVARATSLSADKEEGTQEVLVTGSRVSTRGQADRLRDIVRLSRSGHTRAARRELGSFLTDYPDFELPDDFPVDPASAIYPKSAEPGIVQPAHQWLKDIAALAHTGERDLAREQLMLFFDRYPDYTLPNDFPLSRNDAQLPQQ